MKRSFLSLIILTIAPVFIVTSMATAVRGPNAPAHQGQEQSQGRAQRQPGQPMTATPGARPDPAMQAQTSLTAAASAPIGNGTRVDKPAAGIVGNKRHVRPSQVLPDPSKTGMTVNGCLIGYGIPGVECTPVHSGLSPKLPRN